MRCSGGTNFALFLSVVVLTKSTIAFFAGPSFHEASRSAPAADAAAVNGVKRSGAVEQPEAISATQISGACNDRWIFISMAPVHPCGNQTFSSLALLDAGAQDCGLFCAP
jgi:hypothetical protein